MRLRVLIVWWRIVNGVPHNGSYPAVATRLFILAVLLSIGVFLAGAVASAIAGRVDSDRQFLCLGQHLHVTVSSRGLDRRVVVFNDPQLGPGLRGIIPGSQGTYPSILFDSVPGVSIVSVGVFDVRNRFWTSSLSLWYLLGLSAVLPLAWLVGHRRRSGRGFPVEGIAAAG
ncbi:MAG: hypothetical protein JWM57_3374 [Phycisphaerales bacterium]|nr:hypothetical protein [Phycisphaerales bacterium]